jgi:hypothetical protein
MDPNLKDAARWVRNEEQHKIRLAKIEEVMKTWDDLFFILAGEEVFKKSPGVSDYSSFEKSMRSNLEEARKKLKEGSHTETYHKPPSVLLDQLDKLVSVNYTPPQDAVKIAADLLSLITYYHSNIFLPSIEMILDLSMCKLIRAVSKLFGAAKARGETILTGRKKQKEEIANKKAVTVQAASAMSRSMGNSDGAS